MKQLNVNECYLIEVFKKIYKVRLLMFLMSHPQTIFYIDRCIEHCSAALHFKIQKAEALALMGKYQESQELAKFVHFNYFIILKNIY